MSTFDMFFLVYLSISFWDWLVGEKAGLSITGTGSLRMFNSSKGTDGVTRAWLDDGMNCLSVFLLKYRCVCIVGVAN